MLRKVRFLTAVVTTIAAGLIASASHAAAATADSVATAGGLQLWVPESGFQGDAATLEKAAGGELAREKLPLTTSKAPVIASATQLAAFDSATGRVDFYTRQGKELTRRGSVGFAGVSRFQTYKLIADDQSNRAGVEVYQPADHLVLTVYLSSEGIFELRPAAAGQLTLGRAGIQYAIVPCFVGADLVFDAKSRAHKARTYIPSTNLMIGLIAGQDCMLVATWAPGEQMAWFETRQRGGENPLWDDFCFETAGHSLFLSYLQNADLWHAEPLKADYVERDTAIGWKRPFEAKWIGRIHLANDEIDYPFYFRHERMKMWGRCIRGWFYYPVWFNGDQTIIHFEKHFPPRGEMLVYYLEDHPQQTAAQGSPVRIMETALGRNRRSALLDFAGAEERLLLKHHNAVCEMTDTLQEYFDAGQEVNQRALVDRYCDDVADFIGMIRDRIHEFGAHAGQLRAFLEGQAKAQATLADSAGQLEEILDEMEQARANGMPSTSLDEVRRWTAEMKSLAAEVRPGNNKKYEKLASQCRSVAGSQDDLARDLSVLAIRLSQEAAQAGRRIARTGPTG